MTSIKRRAALLALLALVGSGVTTVAEARAGRAIADDCDSGDDNSCQSAPKKGGK